MNNTTNNNQDNQRSAGNASQINHDISNFTANTSTSGVSILTPEDTHVSGAVGEHVTMSTTTFVEDANIVRRDESRMNNLDSSLLQINDTDRNDQNIKTFLAKPIVVRSGSFNITDTYSFLDTLFIPFTIFSASNASVWIQKLSGIYGIRFDIRFKLVVNANRFQMGRYCIGYVPLCSPERSTSNLKELAFNNMHLATLVQRTTVPHVELDLCDDTSCELLVPFQSVQPFYNFNEFLRGLNDQMLGTLNIYPYAPLTSPAGSTTCGYTLYASLENVTLFGAASAQSGIKVKKGLGDKEVSNSNNGPISGPATAIANGFREFSKIPLLSSYVLPVSWIADRVANVASIFGFSKPVSGDSLNKVMILSAPNHNTIDGDSDARPMSYLSKPGVSHLDGLSRTEFDEMDFSYLVRKFAWFQTIPWNISQVSGTVLTTIPVENEYSVVLGGSVHQQPVSFVSSFFSQWRGSLVYKIKIVRTEFHSGRIQIAFFPGKIGGVLSANAVYVHRLVVDIRESSEILFTVPFISQYLWSRNGEAIGNIVVSVIDSLVAPATVTSTISLLFEVAGGEDFEVSIPRTTSFYPTLFTPQSGDVSVLTNTVIGSSVVHANPLLATSVAIGDKITSFRPLLRRFCQKLFLNGNTVTGTRLNDPNYYIAVDELGVLSNGAGVANYMVPDFISMIGSCYGMWRGGIRYRLVINGSLSTTEKEPSIVVSYFESDTMNSGKSNNANPGYTPISATFQPRPLQAHSHFQDLRNNSVVTTEVPQYTRMMARAVCDTLHDTAAGTTNRMADTTTSSVTQGRLYYALPQSLTEGVGISQNGRGYSTLFRSLADDGNFSVFISIPPFRSVALADTVTNFY
jgi:hypothetical protein